MFDISTLLSQSTIVKVFKSLYILLCPKLVSFNYFHLDNLLYLVALEHIFVDFFYRNLDDILLLDRKSRLVKFLLLWLYQRIGYLEDFLYIVQLVPFDYCLNKILQFYTEDLYLDIDHHYLKDQ